MIVTDIPVRLPEGIRRAGRKVDRAWFDRVVQTLGLKSGTADPRESNTPHVSASCRPRSPSRLSRNAIPAHPMLVVMDTLRIPYPCRRSEHDVSGATCASAEQLVTRALPAPTRVGLAAAIAATNVTVTRTAAGTAADRRVRYTPPEPGFCAMAGEGGPPPQGIGQRAHRH